MNTPLRILVADDNPVFLRLMETFVHKCGYEPVPAADGSQALAELLRPDAPRLAILDWEMPGYTGPEVCRLLRERPRPRTTYIILLSARTEPAEVVEGLHSGASDYVRKPMHHEEMRHKLGIWSRIVQMEEELHRRSAAIPTATGPGCQDLVGEVAAWWQEALPIMTTTPAGRALAARMDNLLERSGG
jgi:DNA-binding response OmpR family regulator